MRVLTVITLAAAVSIALPAQAQKKDGDAIFQEMCVGCHGADGHADTEMGKKVHAADLTTTKVHEAKNSELEKVVKNGQKKMPSFADKLGEDDIKAVVAYVKQLGKGK